MTPKTEAASLGEQRAAFEAWHASDLRAHKYPVLDKECAWFVWAACARIALATSEPPDCRTCAKFSGDRCLSTDKCVEGANHKPLMPVQLWGDPPAPQAANNGGKTGSPPGMLQDDDRGLSKWLSNQPNAKQEAREAAAAIATQPVGERLPLTDEDFETWWQQEGQFGRAGGGDYEKTFAFNAWNAVIKALKEPT